jgi:hypothetical protein
MTYMTQMNEVGRIVVPSMLVLIVDCRPRGCHPAAKPIQNRSQRDPSKADDITQSGGLRLAPWRVHGTRSAPQLTSQCRHRWFVGKEDAMDALPLDAQLAIGMTVFDAAGDKLGTLAGSDAYVLIVEQGFFFPTDFSVPMAAVVRVDADGIWLSLMKDDVRQEAEAGGTPADGLLGVAQAPI